MSTGTGLNENLVEISCFISPTQGGGLNVWIVCFTEVRYWSPLKMFENVAMFELNVSAIWSSLLKRSFLKN